jgi:hypothetical protein
MQKQFWNKTDQIKKMKERNKKKKKLQLNLESKLFD